MKPALQRRIQRYGWDLASSLYEEHWRAQLAPAQDRMLALAGLRPGEAVVDVACGTGLVTLPAARAVGDRGRVVATDISQQMIELGESLAAAAGLGSVDFRRMDAEALTLEDGTFDVSLCALGLMYFPRPVEALREMLRVLAPGGRVVVAVWGDRRACGWAEIFPIVDKRVETEVCPMFFQLGTGDALSQALRTAGFDDVRAERLDTLLEYESAEAACGAAFAGGPVALAYSRFDEPTRAEAHEEYVDSLAGFAVGPGYRLPGQFVVASAVKPS